MPGMDGAQTFASLRLLRGDIPVLFMSGYSEDLIGELIAGKENVASLRKPFRIDGLMSGLRGLLQQGETPTLG